MADNEQPWVLVDTPEGGEQPAAAESSEPEPEPKEPTPEPEPEPKEPTPEPEPKEPTPEPEPEPEPKEPTPEPEPEPEPKEPTPEPEPEPEPKEPTPEPEPKEPTPEPEPKEPTPEPEPKEPTPEPEATKDETEEDKPADETPAAEDVTVEVTVDVGGEEEKPEEKVEEEVLPEPGEEILYGSYLRLCQVGTDMIKVKKSKGFPRTYHLEEDLLSIVWDSKHKPASKAKIPVSLIKEVRVGRSTDSFRVSKDTHSEDVCFSILYLSGNTYKTLDLAALTVADRTAWVEGLKAILRQETSSGKGDRRSKVRERWLRDLFDGADKDSSGTLDVKEVLKMMHGLNVGISSKVLKQKFKAADSDGNYDGTLDFEEFCALFKELAARPELKRLFNLYSSKMEWLTVKDLQKFLQLEQGADNPSLETCTQLIQKYEPTDEGKAQGWMSIDGFSQFMLGPENDIINVDRSSVVFQDMTQPLSHYYIASSHNTYLLEDQLKGPSSCEAYIRALRKGCRCVELDCWDGPDGEPIIYHGHTLTSKILFCDVIEAIKEHAFAATPYPVILSIENHCSIPQQHRMAEIMKDIFGDLLYDNPRDEDRDVLPCPEELKRKILVKGKKLSRDLEDQDDDEGEVTDEDEADEIDQTELKKVKPEPAAEESKEEPPKSDAETKPSAEGEDKPVEDKPAGEDKPAAAEGGDEPKAEGETENKKDEEAPKKEEQAAAAASPAPKKQRSMSFRSRQKKTAAVTQKPKKKIKLSSKLSKCINYIQSVHFPGIDSFEGSKPYHMSSFGESTANKLSKDNATRYVVYNRRQISRTYPAGGRVNSSNYDPVHMWNAGCQIVALNYQTPGKAMDFNEGKFRDNGGSGYVLKPSIMREELSRYDHNQRNVHLSGFNPKVITVKVISGQQLPKPSGDKKGEIIDPYIIIQVAGVDVDNQSFKTKPVSDNGFNPVWNESFQILIKHPELAMVRIKVMDKDWGPNQDDFIGSYTLPVDCLVPGYRHVHLTNAGNKLETGSVFVHVQIQDYVAPQRSAGKVKTSMRLKKSREYPEHHLVGHAAIDLHFRNAPTSLHRAVDLREDYSFSLLHFKELCGHGPQASLMDCVELMVVRAKNAGLGLSLEELGDSEDTRVYRVSVSLPEGEEREGVVVPPTVQVILEAFNQLNGAIHNMLVHASPAVNELETIYKEAQDQQNALRAHLKESPTPNKKPDLVIDHYARTMYTIKTETDQLQSTKSNAADTLKKLFSAAQNAGVDIKTSL